MDKQDKEIKNNSKSKHYLTAKEIRAIAKANAKEMKRLEDFYNDGVVDDAMAESLLNMIDEVTPTSVSDSIEEAFGNVKERKERLKNMDWGDYI